MPKKKNNPTGKATTTQSASHPVSQVELQINQLFNEIDELVYMHNEINTRLSDILFHKPFNVEEEAETPSLCPLAERIKIAADKIHGEVETLKALYQAIEL